MRVLRSLLIIIVCLAVLAGAAEGVYLWFVDAAHGPGPLASPITIVIPPGSGLKAISRQLADSGVVQADWMVEVEARRLQQARALKPGEYKFDANVSIDDALGKIVRRDVVAHYVTIPEGLVITDILRLLDAAPVLQGAVTETLHDGDLLPETYRYEWGDTRAGLIGRMKQARTALLAELWAGRATDLPLKTPAEAVVLASIVEKETGLAAERPKVAAVFINRLRRSMRLQSDPTVAYGLSAQEPPHVLTRANLEQTTAFNTYVIDGLPPAPICNPGRASLNAVLNPADIDDLYFVADGSGGHAFAATLDDHNRNVAHWRQLQRQNGN